MKKYIKILMICMTLAFTSVDAYSQFIQNSSRSLFSDVKAFKQGDALTVLIIEDTQADNSASTIDARSTDVDLGFGVGIGSSANTSGSGNLGTGTKHSGQGRTSRSEKIRSKLSVRVTEVDQSGNLKVEGTRSTKINGETQKVSIQGLVRPVDILSNNAVFSYNILDLSLTIEGEGSVSTTQEPGLITKFLRILF